MEVTKNKTNNFLFILYLLILLEGFVVLSTELLSIRLLIPFVGSGTEVLAIIIAAVLMPLAIGYYIGGNNRTTKIRQLIIKNICKSILILAFGLSYICLIFFFQALQQLHLTNYLAQTTIYCIFFLVYPIFLIGQTIPLLGNFFAKQKLANTTGNILFFSTTGSFIGSIITTLLLMSLLGTHNTSIIILSALFIMLILLIKPTQHTYFTLAATTIIITIILNSSWLLKNIGVVSNNAYSTIYITHKANDPNTKILNINHSYSSQYNKNNKKFLAYAQYINYFLPKQDSQHIKKILIIGAGGFTLGINDKINKYTYVDIDPNLKNVAEKHFLQQKLTANKKFLATPARAFINTTTEKFDYIILDAYSNTINMPQQLLTQEFLYMVKSKLNNNSLFIFNAIANPQFKDAFSIKLDNTLQKVFGNINRQIINPKQNLNKTVTNIIYSYYNNKITTKKTYSDLFANYFLDH